MVPSAGSPSSHPRGSRLAPSPIPSRSGAGLVVAEVVLGIETSCDETSAAVLVKGELAGLSILSQDVHQIFGGVVPELASRAHLAALPAVLGPAPARAGRGSPHGATVCAA